MISGYILGVRSPLSRGQAYRTRYKGLDESSPYIMRRSDKKIAFRMSLFKQIKEVGNGWKITFS